MRNAKVLVINIGALANEIVKNIVLAGIGSLSILDSNDVSANDLGAQFFLEESDIGKKASNKTYQQTSLIHVYLESRSCIHKDTEA